jgi:hypothetical protein
VTSKRLRRFCSFWPFGDETDDLFLLLRINFATAASDTCLLARRLQRPFCPASTVIGGRPKPGPENPLNSQWVPCWTLINYFLRIEA